VQDPHATLPPGTVLDGRYQIHSVLGRGAMGTVYQVEHLGIGRQLALKVLHTEMSTSASLRERFTREARSTARLEHPGIVQVTDFGRTPDDAPYMVMELVRGRQLSQLSASEVSFDRAIAMMQQVLRALEHAHARKVVHRDLKPDNIMLVEGPEGEDQVKVLDFGLAMLLQPQGSPRITHAGAVFGTPRYMSPEQASGESVDHRADLYAVAVMLVEVLTSRALFDGETAAEVLAKQVTQAPEFRIPPHEGWNHHALQRVLHKGLSKHPKDRFGDARSLRKAISGCRLTEVPEAELSIADLDAVQTSGAKRWFFPLVAAAAVIIAGFVWMQSVDLDPAQRALAAGELDTATELTHELLEDHPKDARVHMLQGHVDFARGDVKDAIASYGRALQLDPGAAADPYFDRNVRTLVSHEDPALARTVHHLTRKPVAEAAPLLAHIARAAHKWPVRRGAYEALERTGDFADLDPVAYLSAQLEDNSTRVCSIRRWYVERLVRLDDPRARPALERESARRGCARKLIQEALAKWGDGPQGS